jgi:hypothetical protein
MAACLSEPLAELTFNRGIGFAFLMIVALIVSAVLFALCRWWPWGTLAAILLTIGWVAFRVPDLRYYLETRNLSPETAIIEPFYRRDYVLEYIIAFTPILFLILAIYRRRRGHLTNR